MWDFLKARAYGADGKGTLLNSTARGAVVSITSTASSSHVVVVSDRTRPEIIQFALEADPFNSARNIVVFSVRDVESGVKQTEARVRRIFGWSDWYPVQNVVAIDKDAFAVELRVTNNQGSISAAILYNWRAVSVFLVELFVAGLGVLVVCIFVLKRIKRHRSRRR